MKKIIFITLAFALFCNIAYSQEEKEESGSKTVQLLNKQGTLLKKDFYEIGMISPTWSMNGAVFKNIIITDISTNEKVGALQIIIAGYVGVLDYDEIEGCIKSIEYIKNNIISDIPNNPMELEYLTKDKLSLGCFIKEKGKSKEWAIFIQSNKFRDDSFITMKAEKIDEIISLLNKSLENLNSNF